MRYPVGTPYQGPSVNYDAMMSPEKLLERIVYGRPAPLLRPYQRMDAEFFGRLFDQLANSHAAFVKVCASERDARRVAAAIRAELPTELYEVGCKQDPDAPMPDEWFVVAYNRITKSMRRPAWHDMLAPTQEWVDTVEAARVLRVSRQQAGRLAQKYQLDTRRAGGRNQILIQRSDLPLLANRPGRHRPKD